MKIVAVFMRAGRTTEGFVFPAEELKKSIPTLIDKPVTLNYDSQRVIGKVDRAWWDEEGSAIMIEATLDSEHLANGFAFGYAANINTPEYTAPLSQ